MKIALLALLGLVLGTLGGAALGVGAGLAWVEIFNTSNFEGYSGMLVFFSFMPIGAIVGGLGGAMLFRHARLPRHRNRHRTAAGSPFRALIGALDCKHSCNAKTPIAFVKVAIT